MKRRARRSSIRRTSRRTASSTTASSRCCSTSSRPILRGQAQRGDHRQSEGARRGRRARSRARAGQDPRAAARHSRSRSRTTSTRPTCRRPAARWRSTGCAAVRGDADEEPARRRRDHHRQDRLTELANWVAGAPTPMPGNYNAVGGYGFNPYDPRRDPREATFDGRPVLQTGGSSSGIGTAANFWAANVGTETSGSILSPSNQNMLAASSRRSAASAATASSRSPPIRTRPGRWRRRSPTRRSCSARSKARRPIRTIRRRRRARRRRAATTRSS
jgi:hypothetical protein